MVLTSALEAVAKSKEQIVDEVDHYTQDYIKSIKANKLNAKRSIFSTR